MGVLVSGASRGDLAGVEDFLVEQLDGTGGLGRGGRTAVLAPRRSKYPPRPN